MAVTTEQLDDFHRFATEKVNNGQNELSWDELFLLWQSTTQREETNNAIRDGLADVAAGRYEPARDAMEKIRKEFDLPE